MVFSNARLILQKASGWSAIKLLLLAAGRSRPGLKMIWTPLLWSYVRSGEIPITYTHSNRTFRVFLRLADQDSDLHSILEVLIRQVYPLNPAYAADLVIDGGANIGLFSLQAASVYPSAKLIACEPLPRNIVQLNKHLNRNHVTASVMSVCVGGAHGTIPFYCRGANASSFNASTPYDDVLSIEVLSLQEVVAASSAQRILIKLDIEGMEIEALQSYVPTEQRSVIVLGELHGHKHNRGKLESLFAQHRWSFQLGDLSGDDAIFEARSPAALRLLPNHNLQATSTTQPTSAPVPLSNSPSSAPLA
jgi:FkbM family methyltransferase